MYATKIKVILAKINVFPLSSGAIILAQERTPKSPGLHFLRIWNLFFIGEKSRKLDFRNFPMFLYDFHFLKIYFANIFVHKYRLSK